METQFAMALSQKSSGLIEYIRVLTDKDTPKWQPVLHPENDKFDINDTWLKNEKEVDQEVIKLRPFYRDHIPVKMPYNRIQSMVKDWKENKGK